MLRPSALLALLSTPALLVGCGHSSTEVVDDGIAPRRLEAVRYVSGSPASIVQRIPTSPGMWKCRSVGPRNPKSVSENGITVKGVRVSGAGKRSVAVRMPNAVAARSYEMTVVVDEGHAVDARLQCVLESGTQRAGRIEFEGTGKLQTVSIPCEDVGATSAVVVEFDSDAEEFFVSNITAVTVDDSGDASVAYAVGPSGAKRPGRILAPGNRIAIDLPSDAGSVVSFSTRSAGDESSSLIVYLNGERRQTADAKPDSWTQKRFDVEAGPDRKRTVELEVPADAPANVWVAETRVDGVASLPPTVLLITSDTHRADHIGPTGAPGIVSTPALDELAKRGVVFTNCFATTNVTNPSHIALMTGLHVRDHGISNNRTALSTSATTLAETFRNAGYRTFGAISFLHLSDNLSGLGQGFDRYNEPLKGRRDSSRAISKLARWMKDAEGQPVFAWLHVGDAHAPYEPPDPFLGRYSDDSMDDGETVFSLPDTAIPNWVKSLPYKDERYIAALYRGAVDYVDHTLEDLFDMPRVKAGIVAFTSDHGESFGTDGVWWDHRRLNVDSMHVPLIFTWPGAPVIEADAPVRQIDIGTTMAALAGVDGEFPGRDLRWALDDPEATRPRFGLSAHGYTASIEADGWLLSLQLKPYDNPLVTRTWEYGEVELFNLNADPKGLVNVLDSEFDRAVTYRKRLIEWLVDSNAAGLGVSVELSEEAEKGLEALGYGGGESAAGDAWWEEQASDPWINRFLRDR